LIAEKICAHPHQRITFAQFMDLALYQSQYGYYASGSVQLGAQGDFFTAPEVSADFAQLLAEQFVQMWLILEKPDPFTLVEMGAGSGILARDLLRYVNDQYSEFATTLDYCISERSTILIQLQQACLAGISSVRWQSFDQIDPASITGCFFSNELVDAFPVHQVTIQGGKLQEIYITVMEQGSQLVFEEVLGDLSTPALADYFQLVGINIFDPLYPEGYRTEINLAALDWIKTVADRLKQGYLLTIDYGYPAHRYYHPARSQGTLLAYRHHTTNDSPYTCIGQQDLTAHVDFTALEKAGLQWGLHWHGLTQQSLFLASLGLLDRIAALSQSTADLRTVLQRRQALHWLMDPTGLGNFGVVIQSQGLTPQQQQIPLKGLTPL
jgi:SAM-dependent MidA family methyltransferase